MADQRTFQRLLVIGIFGLALSIGGLFLLRSRMEAGASGGGTVLAAEADSPEAFATIKPFELTNQAGAAVTLDTFRGRPWIASFVFTRCSGPCPRISASMKKLQGILERDDVHLVTFSVDPQNDTPPVMAEYARTFGADATRWSFLTGTPEALRDLSFQSFQLPFERDEAQPVGQLVTHKTLLTVIDARGVIRGYYDGESDAGVAQAAARARFLARTP